MGTLPSSILPVKESSSLLTLTGGRLLHGTTAERNRWRLIGSGEGIHWPDLDEDVSVQPRLQGPPGSPVARQQILLEPTSPKDVP
ncbi:MAG: DUF2442 domain-containing protein [candidate division NC10 bacterium]